MIVKCAECECTPVECNKVESSESTIGCINCTKEDECCCLDIHAVVVGDKDQCCSDSSCTRFDEVRFTGLTQIKATNNIQYQQPDRGLGIRSFFFYAKGLYAAALRIEILCIAAAENRRKHWFVSFRLQCWWNCHCLRDGVCSGWFCDFCDYPW